MSDYIFVVLVDVTGDSLADAYRNLRKQLLEGGENLSWETSEEWYGEGTNEEPGDPAVLQTAIVSVLDEERLSSICQDCGLTVRECGCCYDG